MKIWRVPLPTPILVHKTYAKWTTKELREAATWEDPILMFKMGIITTTDEARRLSKQVKGIKDTYGRSLVLKLLHGDLHYNKKYFKSNFREDDKCSISDESESLEHKLWECSGINIFWSELAQLLEIKTPDHRDIICKLENTLDLQILTHFITTLTASIIPKGLRRIGYMDQLGQP